VLKIQRIDLRNFKCYSQLRLPEEGTLPDGLILIDGENSSGKSTLLEAIQYALWGIDALRSYKNEDIIKYGESECEVKLTFEIDGEVYQCIRKFNRSNVTNAWLFKKFDDGSLREVCRAGSKNVSDKIRELLRINMEQAQLTVIIRQGEVEKLAEMRDSDMRDLIIRLFNLDIIDKMKKTIKEQIRAINSTLSYLRQKFTPPERLMEEKAQLKNRLQEEKKKLEKLDREIKNFEVELKKFPSLEIAKKIRTLKIELETKNSLKRRELERLKKLKADLGIKEGEDAARKVQDLEKTIDQLKQLNNKKKEMLSELKSKKAKLLNQIELYETRIYRLEKETNAEKGEAKCPVCDSPISYAKKQELIEEASKIIENCRKEIKDIDLKIAEVDDETKKIEKQIEQLKETINKYMRLREEIDEYKKIELERKKVYTALEKAVSEVGFATYSELLQSFKVSDIQELIDKITSLNNEINSNKRLKNEKLSTMNKIEQDIKKLENEIDEMIKMKSEMEKQEKISSHLKKLEELLKRFITEYVVQERLLTSIRYTTSGFLYRFSRGQYNELDLISTNSRGSPGISMYVNDVKDGFSKKRELLSGGDKAIVGLSLRLGISELMKRIRPTRDTPHMTPKINFLVLDEPLGAIDIGRRKEVLDALQVEEDFRQIFLITHTEIPQEIKEKCHRILVERTDSGSKARLVS